MYEAAPEQEPENDYEDVGELDRQEEDAEGDYEDVLEPENTPSLSYQAGEWGRAKQLPNVVSFWASGMEEESPLSSHSQQDHICLPPPYQRFCFSLFRIVSRGWWGRDLCGSPV